MAELADAQDLKSCGTYLSYRFDSGLRHHHYRGVEQLAARRAHNPKVASSSLASATINLIWPIGQAVKTPPFHGGNRGSIPLWVTKKCGCSSMVEFRPSKPAVRVRSPSPAPFYPGTIAQLGEHLPYKQGVTGSSPVSPTNMRPGSSVG